MEKPKTVLDYIAETFSVFGLTVTVCVLLALLLGDKARDFSTLFSLGSKGLSAQAMAQLLLLSAGTKFFRFLFFTDKIIRRGSLPVRIAAMILCTVGLAVLCIVVFRWFPANMPEAWIGFCGSSVLCFISGFVISSYKERLENKKMADALEKMKKGEE